MYGHKVNLLAIYIYITRDMFAYLWVMCINISLHSSRASRTTAQCIIRSIGRRSSERAKHIIQVNRI